MVSKALWRVVELVVAQIVEKVFWVEDNNTFHIHICLGTTFASKNKA